MGKFHILIVDDEAANIFLLEEILDEYAVTSARSANEMFDILEEVIPDLILLDVMMPGMDGLCAAEQLKKNRNYNDIPVIFISAKISGDDIAKGFHSGAEDYIKKPFDGAELLARVQKILTDRTKMTELYMKATRDALTGIFNRDYFHDFLIHKIKKFRRDNSLFSIGMIDIDYFKKINDTYGHQAGDTVLYNFAQYIHNSLRESDVIARYGGEEFICIIDMSLKHKARQIIDRIRENLLSVILDPGNNLQVTFSCGLSDISEVKNHDSVAEMIIKTADMRLYTAKRMGRNRVIIDD